MTLAIIDIDGVLADARWRLPLIARDREGGRDFEAFYAKVGEDRLFEAGAMLARSLQGGIGAETVYLTGRSETCRAATETWLYDNWLPRGDIRMRPEGDHRNAAAWKLEQVERIAAELGEKVSLVIDDDPEVCRVLTQAGYPVLQCLWGRS